MQHVPTRLPALRIAHEMTRSTVLCRSIVPVCAICDPEIKAIQRQSALLRVLPLPVAAVSAVSAKRFVRHFVAGNRHYRGTCTGVLIAVRAVIGEVVASMPLRDCVLDYDIDRGREGRSCGSPSKCFDCFPCCTAYAPVVRLVGY